MRNRRIRDGTGASKQPVPAARLLLGIVCLLAPTSSALAQSPFTVTWKVSPLSVPAGGKMAVESRIQIPPGHYLYKSETSLGLKPYDGFQFQPQPMPPAVSKIDPFQNKPVDVYEGSVILRGEVFVSERVKPGPYTIILQTNFQGCAKTSCFLPETSEEKVDIVVTPSVPRLSGEPAEEIRPPQALDTAEGEIASSLAQKGLFYTLLLCFAAGIGLSLTPCVYPLLPITVGVIGASSLGRPARGFILSLAYVMGISLTYAALGVLAASTGKVFGSYAQSPWVAGFVGAVFFALSLSLLGAYEFPMFTKLAERYQGRTGTGLLGVFVMGLIAGLVASPCVGPVLVGLLVYISTTGNAMLGFLMLLATGWGMGLLLIILGTFSGAISLLPKSGVWMITVKQVFGLLMLGAAMYYVKPILPWPIFMGALAVIFIALSVFAGGFDPLPSDCGLFSRLQKTFAILCFALGLCAVAALALPWLAPGVMTPSGRIAGGSTENISWILSEPEGLAQAKKQGKPVMMDFSAEWCAACKELDAYTFTDPEVVRESKRFVAVKIDLTHSATPESKALAAKYGIVGLPTIIFIDSEGRHVKEKTVHEYITAEKLLGIMRSVH